MKDKYSYVKNMPTVSSIFKEKLYDHLIGMGLDPNDETIIPLPAYLHTGIGCRGTDDTFCTSCVIDLVKSIITEHYDKFYYTKTAPVYDTPISCVVCDTRLMYSLKDPSCAQAVILWSSRRVRAEKDLSQEDWYDLWTSTNPLTHDNELWDHIGFILDKRGAL